MKRFIYFLLIQSIAFSLNSNAQDIDPMLAKYSELKPNIYFDLYFSNVYSYFEPNSDVSTPLKKNTYESTQEYRMFADSLKRIKSALLKNHYIKINIPDAIEYDLKKGGINILLSSRFTRREVQGIYNVYEPEPDQDSKFYISFTNLSLKQESVYPQMPDLSQREEYLFIPLSKAIGLEFENSSSAKLYIIITPTDKFKNTKVEHLAYRSLYDAKYIFASAKSIILLLDDKVVYTRNL